MSSHKRRVKLIKPQLQLKIVAAFLCVAVLCTLVQFTMMCSAMSDVALSVPGVGNSLNAILFQIIYKHLFITMGMAIPLTVFVGILVTHRVAGPIYRMEKHLQGMLDGTVDYPCSLRERDEFHELCELINKVTADRLGESSATSESIEKETVTS